MHVVPDQTSGKLGPGPPLFRGAANAGATMQRPARRVPLLAERWKVGGSHRVSDQKWRSDYEVVTTTTDVSYVNAEIASAITDN